MTAHFYTYNVIFDMPVSGNSKLVYAYLCKCADTNGKCYPSHKAIGANAGIGVTTVKKALAELESAGLISIQGQARPDRGRRANIYTVIKEKVCGFFLTYINVFDNTLTAKARLVYLYFCRLASGREQAYPSHKNTAKACGLSVAGVRIAIDELEATGIIARQAQYRDNGGQRANLYTIITEPNKTDAINAPKTLPEQTEADQMKNNPSTAEETNSSESEFNSEEADHPDSDHTNDDNAAADSTDNDSTEEITPIPTSSTTNSDTADRFAVARRTIYLFVLPLLMFSTMNHSTPDSAASIFTVMLRAWRWIKFHLLLAFELCNIDIMTAQLKTTSAGSCLSTLQRENHAKRSTWYRS